MIKNKKIIIDWTLLILWLGLIFYLSSIPSLRSSFPDTVDLVLRKGAHLLEYFILAGLFYRVLSNYIKNKKSSIVVAIIFTATYAITDELHQSFVVGRHFALLDILIDTLGAILFMVVYYLTKKVNKL